MGPSRGIVFFARQVGELAIVSTQNPVSLRPDSEPQPDILLLKPPPDRYRNALPTAADVMLLSEVADTTFKYDLEIKLPAYARHGIAEAWLIDLKGGQQRLSQAIAAGPKRNHRTRVD